MIEMAFKSLTNRIVTLLGISADMFSLKIEWNVFSLKNPLSNDKGYFISSSYWNILDSETSPIWPWLKKFSISFPYKKFQVLVFLLDSFSRKRECIRKQVMMETHRNHLDVTCNLQVCCALSFYEYCYKRLQSHWVLWNN